MTTPGTLDYHAVKAWPFGDLAHAYSERDTILYALGAGIGSDPVNEAQLRFVYEKNLCAMPSMPTVFGSPGPWWRDPRTGVDYSRNLHVEQDLEIFAEIPVAGTAIGRNRVTALHDRGAERGALAGIERDILDASTGTLLARSRRIELLRGAGGFSAISGVSDEAPRALPPIGDAGPPDLEFDLSLSPRTGLIYRLSGDLNPLHVDPETARNAGFPRPILHGLGTYAFACHAVLRALADFRPERIKRLAVRFSAPVYPGDVLRFQFWRDVGNTARLRALVPERQATALDNGIVVLAG